MAGTSPESAATAWQVRLRSMARPVLASSLVPSQLDPVLKRIARRRRRSEGVPSGVDFPTLEEVCRKEWGRRLKRVWHTPISSWRGAGAAFVWLEMEGRVTKRVVVKASSYEADVFVASTETLVEAGPPELWAYRKAEPILRAFLPRTILAAEAASGRSGVYVLEDLSWDYGRGENTLRDGVMGMFRMQAALASAVETHGDEELIRYDAAFSRGLIAYAENAITAYDGGGDGSIRERVLGAWPRLEGAYLDDEFDVSTDGVPIHGDYNGSNVFVHRRDRRVKAVDWEWTGYGTPHADLASYLKKASTDVVSWALDLLAKRDESRTRHEHERIFLRSVLERALLDASLNAMQHTSDRGDSGYLGPRVNRALVTSLRSLDQLRNG